MLSILAAAAIAGLAGACSSVTRLPYTSEQAALAEIPNIPGVRTYGDASAAAFLELGGRRDGRRDNYSYLALSGGGGDGAYGAGLLNGWSASGTRPVFSLVSGVSTGAVIAPFAFLGSDYDSALTEIYTSGIAGSVVQSPSVVNVLFGSGLFADGKLRELVGRYVTPEFLAAIAAEHAKGRRLLVVTTNLDSERGVIWNMGAIAASGAPNAASLFADVIAASASIPAVFPPQLIDVQAGDKTFQELHVDGSVVTPVFTLPPSFLIRQRVLRSARNSNIYVIINGRLAPEFDTTPDGTLPIVERAFTTASHARSRATITATYAFSKANGVGFNLAYMDKSMPSTSATRGFETGYMRALYEAGYAQASRGDFWTHTVPGIAAADRIADAGR